MWDLSCMTWHCSYMWDVDHIICNVCYRCCSCMTWHCLHMKDLDQIIYNVCEICQICQICEMCQICSTVCGSFVEDTGLFCGRYRANTPKNDIIYTELQVISRFCATMSTFGCESSTVCGSFVEDTGLFCGGHRALWREIQGPLDIQTNTQLERKETLRKFRALWREI